MVEQQEEGRWPEQLLEADINMIMTITKGPGKPPSYHFPRARAIHDVIVEQLGLQPIDDTKTRGNAISAFLQEAIDAVDPGRIDKHLNSARELLGFSRYISAEIDQIIDRHGIGPSSHQEDSHGSKAVRQHLAKLEQLDPESRSVAIEDEKPGVMSNVTARECQRDVWAPAVVGALYNFLHNHRSQAQSLARRLGLRIKGRALQDPGGQTTKDTSLTTGLSTASSRQTVRGLIEIIRDVLEQQAGPTVALLNNWIGVTPGTKYR